MEKIVRVAEKPKNRTDESIGTLRMLSVTKLKEWSGCGVTALQEKSTRS